MRAMIVLTLCLCALAADARADRDPAYEAELADRLARIAPEAVETFQEATAAGDRSDRVAAEEGFRAVLELAPDFPPALRRLSYYVVDSLEGLDLARRALELEDHDHNRTAVLTILLRFDDREKREEARRLASALLLNEQDDAYPYLLIGQLALETGDGPLLGRAGAQLQRVGADTMESHYIVGLAEAWSERWESAEREIRRAEALGLPPEVASELLTETGIATRARIWRWLRRAGYGALGWAGGLVVLTILGLILSRITLVATERSAPTAVAEPSGGMRAIRKVYAVVLTVTSLYYYVSLPVIVLFVLGAGGGLIYGFMTVGVIPIKLVLIIAAVVLFTAYAMIRSLFVRVQQEDPGRRLTYDEAPGLFEVLEEVASRVGTRPVDTVFLTPDAGVAVFERGSVLKRLAGRTERCLILGLGVLNDMTQVQLKAILAHEYGHFYNKDTAGGGLALHVRRTVMISAHALANQGVAGWFNPAWLFLNAFHRIFLRVSQGASRLQEVLADRWAAITYGAQAFISGLEHVIRRSIEFDVISSNEIADAMREARTARNVYGLPLPSAWSPAVSHPPELDTPQKAIEEQYRLALERTESAFDSHPAPSRRFEWVERLGTSPPPSAADAPAWDLFEDPETLQGDVMRGINDRISAARRGGS